MEPGKLLRPQDYSARTAYRPPASWYRRANRLGVLLTSIGLAPRDTATLSVRGRRSGRIRRLPVVRLSHDGYDYLVAIAGESDWVRNARAADGMVALRRGRKRVARLEEVPVGDRAPVIARYLQAGGERGGRATSASQAKAYFGLDSDPSLEEIAEVASFYPVFRIHYV